jgi:hypothetical protein
LPDRAITFFFGGTERTGSLTRFASRRPHTEGARTKKARDTSSRSTKARDTRAVSNCSARADKSCD